MPHTRLAIRYTPRPGAGPPAKTRNEKIAPPTNTSTKVQMTSLNTFGKKLRIAGAVQKQASFAEPSGVSRQCGKYCSHTSVAPAIAPKSCTTKNEANFV